MGARLPEGKKFLSIDYKDATNEIRSWPSEVVGQALSEELNLSGGELELLLRSLTGHHIELTQKTKGRVVTVSADQETGQLMGSITSFIVLCLVNATVARWSCEIDYRRIFTLLDAPITINGDDALAKIGQRGRCAWEKIGAFCGLVFSVGKVYFSDRFLNINSTTYNYSSDGTPYLFKSDRGDVERQRHFTLVHKINLGLLFGLTRSGGEGTKPHDTLGARAHALLEQGPPDMRETLLASFIHRNQAELGTRNVPWFIPEALGGIGLPTAGRFIARAKDLRLARKIFENPRRFPLPERPHDAPWQTWKYATRRFSLPKDVANVSVAHGMSSLSAKFSELNPGQKATHGFSSSFSLTNLKSMACVEALFRTDLDRLYLVRKTSTVVANYNRSIQRLWNKALLDTTIAMPEPFDPSAYPTKHSLTDVPYFHGASLPPGQSLVTPAEPQIDVVSIFRHKPPTYSRARDLYEEEFYYLRYRDSLVAISPSLRQPNSFPLNEGRVVEPLVVPNLYDSS
jgi:hypothetical protein